MRDFESDFTSWHRVFIDEQTFPYFVGAKYLELSNELFFSPVKRDLPSAKQSGAESCHNIIVIPEFKS